MVKDNRIEILDIYRFIAILSVMLYHYYSRWTPPINSVSLYPFGGNFKNYFSLGYLGVSFFFIISGFVIAFTLTNTDGFFEFWKKRLIRLMPAMLICSLITFIVFRLLDTNFLFPESHSVRNIIFSQTFISPELKNIVFGDKLRGTYINGSYWSLWTEIQFYLIASLIYFINKKNFVFNITFFSICICIVNYILIRVFTNALTTNILHLSTSAEFINKYIFWTQFVFNYIIYSLYFVLGVLFFQIYLRKKMIESIFLLLISIFLLLFLNHGFDFRQFLPIHSLFIMITLFLLFLHYSEQLKFLAITPISNIGIASYSLYLIHENIGVLLINKYATIFGVYSFLFPIIVIIMMICFSLLSYKYIEKPLGLYLKKII